MEDTDPSHPSNTVTRINFTLVFHQILSWILFKITNNKVTSKIRFSINPIQHWVVKLFRMKNTRKIFSYQLFQKKKKEKHSSINIRPPIIPQLLLHFFTKKKKTHCKIFHPKTERLSQERTFSKPYFEGLRVIPRVGIRDCTVPYHTRVARVRMSVVTCSFHHTKNRVKASSCATLVYSREKKAGQSFASIFLSPIRRATMKVYEEDYREMA